MQIFVKSTHGEKFSVELDANDSVEELKNKINEKLGIEVEYIRLNYGGKLIQHGVLSDYFMKENDTVYMVVRLRGGGSKETGQGADNENVEK